MSGLWVPPSAEPLVALREQTDSERGEFAQYMRGLLPETRRMNEELRRIDPYLELVFVGDRAPDDDPAIVPGRWHVIRHNPGAPDTWMPVVGDNNSYVEPTSRIFAKLAEGDMWSADHGLRARKRQAKRAAEKEREKEAGRERRAEEMRERVAAATQVRISFSPEHRWTQNASGNGRRDAGERRRKA